MNELQVIEKFIIEYFTLDNYILRKKPKPYQVAYFLTKNHADTQRLRNKIALVLFEFWTLENCYKKPKKEKIRRYLITAKMKSDGYSSSSGS